MYPADLHADQAVNVFCPSPEDLLIAKMIAGREKDVSFIKYLTADGLVDEPTTIGLLDKLPVDAIGVEKALYVDQMVRSLFGTERDDDASDKSAEAPYAKNPPKLS